MRALPIVVAGLAAALAACGDDGGGAPATDAGIDAGPGPDGGITPAAPTTLTLVTNTGFTGPMDAVVSPDGVTIFFTAHDSTGTVSGNSTAAVFSVPTSGGTPTVLAGGTPLEDPSGLVMSCDGTTLFVSDLGAQSGELEAGQSPIYTVATSGGALATFAATGVGEATGLAISNDCSTLYVSGYKPDGTPAVFTVPTAGGTATILKEGAPLESPSGVYVDAASVAWVMDHLNSSLVGGSLWAIAANGTTTEVVSGLAISEPAGVSLVAGGKFAVIPTRNAAGAGQLLTVDTDTMAETIVAAPEMIEPAGIRTAINAAVMAVVDTDGDAIYKAE